MDFNLSEEHTSFADAVRRFAQSKLADGALQRPHSSAYPVDVARQLAAQQVLAAWPGMAVSGAFSSALA